MSNLQFRTGLVSISFRDLPAEQIVTLAGQAKLDAIEWGGDVHVPHGDLDKARAVRKQCLDAGIACSAYGSYYRAGGDPKSPSFEDVLATAVELGAPTIRVWAGTIGSADATDADFAGVSADLTRIVDLAAAQSIHIALEYHGGTLTDTPEAALSLLKKNPQSNLFSYWQPRHGLSIEQSLTDIQLLWPYLLDVHIFHWWPDHRTRLPLSDGADRWRAYLHDLSRDVRPHTLALEFVKDDDPKQLLDDAKTLHQLLAGVEPRDQ